MRRLFRDYFVPVCCTGVLIVAWIGVSREIETEQKYDLMYGQLAQKSNDHRTVVVSYTVCLALHDHDRILCMDETAENAAGLNLTVPFESIKRDIQAREAAFDGVSPG